MREGWRMPAIPMNLSAGGGPGRPPLISMQPSIDRLQFFSRLESHRPAWRNGNFSTGAGIASNAGFARPHVEYTKSPEFNAVTRGERFLHTFEDCLHGQLSLGLGDPCFGHHFVDDVELDHAGLPVRGSK